MEPVQRPSFQPAGAGALLLGTLCASIGVGTLIGWAAGSTGYGVLGGALAGVPAGVGVVYARYGKAL